MRMAVWAVIALTVFVTLTALLSDHKKVSALITAIAPESLVIILAAVIFNYALRFAKWQFFLRQAEIKVPFKTSLWVFFAAFTMILSPGKLGEVIKSFFLKTRCGIEATKTAPIILAERVTDLAGLLILCLIGFGWSDHGKSAIIALGFLLAAVFFVLSKKWFWEKLESILSRYPKFSRLTHISQNIKNTTTSLFSPFSLMVAIPLSAVSWAGEGVALYIIFKNLGCEIPELIQISIFAHSFSSIIGALSFLPGGLLVTEGTMTAFFLSVKIPNAMAISATILIRAVTLWFAVLIGTMVFLSGYRKEDLEVERWLGTDEESLVDIPDKPQETM